MSEARKVIFGSFDAEAQWRSPDLAALPSVALDPDPSYGLDELLVAFCTSADLLITGSPTSDAVREQQLAAGLGGHREAVPAPGPGGPSGRIEERILGCARLAGAASGAGAVPYSVQRCTAEVAGHLGSTASFPSVTTVAEVNSKSFSNRLVEELGLYGAGRVVTSVDELRSVATGSSGKALVVKDPYGVSGKGSLTLHNDRELQTVARYLTRQVLRGRAVELLVQDHFDIEYEFSAHFDCARDGTLSGPVRVQELRSSAGTRSYQGSAPARPHVLNQLRHAGHEPVMEQVAAALGRAGYFGPVGVDGLVLTTGEVVHVLEINARLSLGRVNVALNDLAGRQGMRSWLSVFPLRNRTPRLEDRLIRALREQEILASRTGGPGVIVLASGPLETRAPRLYCALFATTLDEVGELAAAVQGVVA